MKKHIFFYFLIILALSVGCKKDKDDNTDGTDCSNSVTVGNDSIIVAGCSDFEPTLNFTESGYIITIREKTYGAVGNVQIFEPLYQSYTSMKASMASALRADGWYSQSNVYEHSGGEWQYRITATGQYEVIYAKLPLGLTPMEPPLTFEEAGQTVYGPIHLSGEITFSVDCPDANQAGFSVELFDGNTGEEILDENYHSILGMANMDDSYNQINDYSKTVSLNMANGNYLLKVSANNEAEWTFQIE